MTLMIPALLFMLCSAVCFYVARKRGASTRFWLIMGAFFGPLALPFVFMVKPAGNPVL